MIKRERGNFVRLFSGLKDLAETISPNENDEEMARRAEKAFKIAEAIQNQARSVQERKKRRIIRRRKREAWQKIVNFKNL